MRRRGSLLAVLGALSALAAVPAATARTAAPRTVGCVPHGQSLREHGSRAHRRVALTFDGGPTPQYTPHVLAQLRKYHAHATFFLRGQFIPGHEARLRLERREGHELANHSFSHVDSWDSLYENLPAETIEHRVLDRMHPGSIILMHDGEGAHPGTLTALGPVLRTLQRRHLRVVTVGELLGLRQRARRSGRA